MANDMVEVVIDSIRVSLMSQQRIVILRERNAERYLPIWIGVYEAESITMALQEVEVARPLTHDLVKNIFNELNARVLRVEVVALREDTFFGSIVVETNSHTIQIDARPSDALAVAVRTHVPILVAANVMDVAGIIPEEDLQQPETPASTPKEGGKKEKEIEEGEDRLSIFTDFLDKLDLEDIGGENEESDEGDEEE